MNRPTSWEVKETLDREERDAVVIQKFVQSLVDKMMSILKAEAVYCDVSPATCTDDEDIQNVEEETYEDVVPMNMSPPPREKKANVLSTNTKVHVP